VAVYKLLTAARLLKFLKPPQLALTTHPDKNPDNEAATQQFQQISEAYHVLATYLDKSAHRHEYADPFDAYDDDDDDGGGDDDDEGYLFYDLEELQFYL
jgi:DnaJ-class molecular chaperone